MWSGHNTIYSFTVFLKKFRRNLIFPGSFQDEQHLFYSRKMKRRFSWPTNPAMFIDSKLIRLKVMTLLLDTSPCSWIWYVCSWISKISSAHEYSKLHQLGNIQNFISSWISKISSVHEYPKFHQLMNIQDFISSWKFKISSAHEYSRVHQLMNIQDFISSWIFKISSAHEYSSFYQLMNIQEFIQASAHSSFHQLMNIQEFISSFKSSSAHEYSRFHQLMNNWLPLTSQWIVITVWRMQCIIPGEQLKGCL